jgi:anti-sigma regulatory factor (Ser/Thr protein kinase)
MVGLWGKSRSSKCLGDEAMGIFSGTIASSFQDVNFMVLDIIEILKLKCDIQEKDLLFKISFMLREVLNNAVEHGNHFDEDKKVICIVEYEAPMLIFKIRDHGEGINLKKEPFESADNYLLRERHRGYALIQELNFLVEFDGNEVSVKLNLGEIEKREASHGKN